MSLLEEGVGRKEEQKTTNSFTLMLQKLEEKKKVESCRKELLSLVDTVESVKSTSQGIHRETQGC